MALSDQSPPLLCQSLSLAGGPFYFEYAVPCIQWEHLTEAR